VAGQDCIGITENSARIEQHTEGPPPFPAADYWSIEGLAQRLRNGQYTAVHSYNEGQSTAFRNRECDSAKPPKRVRMDDVDTGLTPEQQWQVKRHEIAADRNQLFFLRARRSPDRHAGMKTFYNATGFNERIAHRRLNSAIWRKDH